jgi:thymidylate synthase (FAD)
MRIIEQSAKLVCITPRADALIERCARVCYKSKASKSIEERAAFIHKLVERGHHSVLEHASATFHIITDRGISHEIVRHRLASYSQESTRYVKYKNIDFITNNVSMSVLELIEQEYCRMLALGLAPGTARAVLPNCLKTELYMTCNFREWRHFITLRTGTGAHPMIRELACSIKAQLARRSVCFV